MIRAALAEDAPRPQPGVGTRLLLRRAKEVLEAEFATPIRLHHVARAVGASPAYLTDLFRRLEGVSMHRYVAQLRLARALVELPHADDLTALALDVGFSSHSHFSASFRRAFGCTPSQFREAARARRRPPFPVARPRRRQARAALAGLPGRVRRRLPGEAKTARRPARRAG